jgi:thiol-disulfide isomerase/thioredoxin
VDSLRRARARLAASALACAALAGSCAASGPAGAPPRRSAYELSLPAATGGARYDLSALSGKVGLVYFFSTWCLPCLQEMKTLATLQRRYEARGFAVVAVGLDLEGAKVLRPYEGALALPFPVLVADPYLRSGRSPYGQVRSVPTTVLLDRTGKIAAAYEGPADPAELERTVARLAR